MRLVVVYVSLSLLDFIVIGVVLVIMVFLIVKYVFVIFGEFWISFVGWEVCVVVVLVI